MLNLKLKYFRGVVRSVHLLLCLLELLNKVLKVLTSVLLLSSLEFLVAFAEKRFEELGADTFLVEFIGNDLTLFIFGLNFLRVFA